MPRSSQIFSANGSLISVCRGTVVTRLLCGLTNTECRLPSRSSAQPCFRKWRNRARRFIFTLHYNLQSFAMYQLPLGFATYEIAPGLDDKLDGFL